MRCFFLLHAGVVLCAASIVTPDAACHFIGSKSAKSFSVCADGFCRNIRRDSHEQAPQLVTCDEAIDEFVKLQTLRSSPVGKTRPSGEVTATKIVEFLDQWILPHLELLELGLNVSGSRFANSASTLDEWTLREASNDWVTWTNVIAPQVTSSSAWTELRSVYIGILALSRKTSYLDREQDDWLTEALLYYFDLVALFGKHLFDEPLVVHVGRLVQHRLHSPVVGVPAAPADIVSLASVVDRVGSGDSRDSDLVRLSLLLHGWEPAVPSAAQALIAQHMAWSLCPFLQHVFASFNSLRNPPAHIKIGVSLIDICLRITSLDLMGAKQMLAAVLHQQFSPVVAPPAGDPADFLKDDSLPWGLGLFSVSESSEMNSFTARSILNDFISYNVPEVAEVGLGSFPLNRLRAKGMGRAFGRAMGLCIIHDAGIGFLRIPKRFARLLHLEVRKRLRTKTQLLLILGSTHIEVLSTVRSGLEETLGPAGFYLYSEARWMDLFEGSSSVF